MPRVSAALIRDKRKNPLELNQIIQMDQTEWMVCAKVMFPQMTEKELIGHLRASRAQSKEDYVEHLLSLAPATGNAVAPLNLKVDDQQPQSCTAFSSNHNNPIACDDPNDNDGEDSEMTVYQSELERVMKAAQNDMETDDSEPMTEQERQAIQRYTLKCLSRFNHHTASSAAGALGYGGEGKNKRQKTASSAAGSTNSNAQSETVSPIKSETVASSVETQQSLPAPVIECGSLLITLNHEAVIVVYADASTVCYVYKNELQNFHDSTRENFTYSWQGGTNEKAVPPSSGHRNFGSSNAIRSMQFSRPFDFIKGQCYGPFSYKFSQYSSLRPVEQVMNDSWHKIWRQYGDTIPLFTRAPVADANSTSHEVTVEFFLFPTERLVVHRAFDLSYAEQIQLRALNTASLVMGTRRLYNLSLIHI